MNFSSKKLPCTSVSNSIIILKCCSLLITTINKQVALKMAHLMLLHQLGIHLLLMLGIHHLKIFSCPLSSETSFSRCRDIQYEHFAKLWLEYYVKSAGEINLFFNFSTQTSVEIKKELRFYYGYWSFVYIALFVFACLMKRVYLLRKKKTNIITHNNLNGCAMQVKITEFSCGKKNGKHELTKNIAIA